MEFKNSIRNSRFVIWKRKMRVKDDYEIYKKTLSIVDSTANKYKIEKKFDKNI